MPARTLTSTIASAALVVAGLAAVSTPAHAAVGCEATYTVTSSWPGGFGAEVRVTNLGDPVSGWSMGWRFPDGLTVASGWNGVFSQSGANVTVTDAGWNAGVATGGSVSVGFTGTAGTTNSAPSAVTFDGVTCTGTTSAPTTSAPTTSATSAPTASASPTSAASPTASASPSLSTSATASTGEPSTGRWAAAADGFAQGTTGGSGGTVVTVTTLDDLVAYAGATEPYVVRVAGAITVTPYGKEIPVASNKTIIGVGTSGEIVNGGLHLYPGTSNVIIRNLTIRDTQMTDDDPDDKLYDYDGIQMDTASNVWIDHNRIVRMNDGLIDSRLDTTNLTVSWNELGEVNKAFGIGWTDNVTSRMTIHHNWMHDTNQRNPSTDNVQYAHLYNNWLQNVTSYGNLSRGATKMVLENSYFDTVKNPYYNDTSAAELHQSGSIVVNSSGKQQTNGSAFDPKQFYSYTLDAAADVPALLRTGAGPQADLGVDAASDGGVVPGTYALRSGASGKCLEVPGGATASGTLVVAATCVTGAARQQWTVVAQLDGFRLTNGASGKCLDVTGGSTTSGTQLQQWGCGNQSNQTWSTLPSAGTSKVQLTSSSSGLCVSVKDGSTASGAPVVQDPCNDAAKVQWGGLTLGATTTSTPVVAADGTGQYTTIQAAIDAIPSSNTTRQVITVKPGTYREIVTVNKPYVTIQGTGATAAQTVIVNNHSAAGGYGTSGSATFFAKATDLVVQNLTISNDYGVGSQAVAANFGADRLTARNVRFLGNQDTLLLNSGRAYIVDSYIEGSVDFIFGAGTAVFDRATIYQVRSTGGPITAARTDAANPYGFLIYKSTITGATNNTTQLGRPWGPDAQVLYRECSLSATIATAQPWTDMSSNVWTAARFSEYLNTGSGATTNSNRPQMTAAQATSYTPQKYLAGSDGWNPIS